MSNLLKRKREKLSLTEEIEILLEYFDFSIISSLDYYEEEFEEEMDFDFQG